MIRKNAELVISQFGPLSGLAFGFDEGSVSWVEGFIERQRATPDDNPDARARISAVLACYLGEAIIAAAGGDWEDTEDGALGIAFDNGNWCFPFAKVAKQFEDGVAGGDSILSFYTISTTVVAKQGFDVRSVDDGGRDDRTRS